MFYEEMNNYFDNYLKYQQYYIYLYVIIIIYAAKCYHRQIYQVSLGLNKLILLQVFFNTLYLNHTLNINI